MRVVHPQQVYKYQLSCYVEMTMNTLTKNTLTKKLLEEVETWPP
jgi:hypothetical protein